MVYLTFVILVSSLIGYTCRPLSVADELEKDGKHEGRATDNVLVELCELSDIALYGHSNVVI